MLRNEKLQLAGPISVIAAISCAELGAQALANWPTSPLLWYLNLEVFRSFRHSFEGIGAAGWLNADGLVQSIWVAVPLLGLICTGLIARNRLPLAIASNLSLIYSAALLYGCLVETDFARELRFNLSGLGTPAGVLAAAILFVSILSSAISHRCYWRDIFP
jgi:hypothetical protein